MGAFTIITSVLSLVTPILTKQVVDIIVSNITGKNEAISQIITLLLIMLAVDILISILTAVSQWIGDIFGEKLQTFLYRKFYTHVLSLHIGYFDNEITGKITNKMMRGIQSITDFIHNMLNNFLPFFFTAFITIIYLAFYSKTVAILLAVLFPAYILISHSSTVAWQKYEQKKNSFRDFLQGRTFESLTGIRVVKAFNGMLSELKSFLANREEIQKLAKTQTKEWHLYDFARRFTLNIILFAIFSYIIYWTFHERFTIGEMTLLLQLVNQARFPLFAMSFILGQIQSASSGSKDFFEVLSVKPEIKDAPDAKELNWKLIKNYPAIEFSQVSFAYEGGKQVLQDIDFAIQAGNKLALVGESGQGKSTLINLLLRFYQPQSGTILLAGQDNTQITQESLRAHVAVVFQESLLFSGTIMENIRYGKPNSTEAEIIAAAKAANAHDFISSLNEGYQSLIGERGVKLSGGQKQRIAIARAILKDAPIIILDEATSALDSKSEIEVQKGLDALMKNRTSIIIAHRLSTIASADHILVLAEGKVAEYGEPNKLIRKKDGLYAGLVELQSKLLKAPSSSNREKLKAFDLVG